MELTLHGRKGKLFGNKSLVRSMEWKKGWYTREGREGVGVGCWKEIRKEGSLLSNNIVFSVGNGRRVRFWKDS